MTLVSEALDILTRRRDWFQRQAAKVQSRLLTVEAMDPEDPDTLVYVAKVIGVPDEDD